MTRAKYDKTFMDGSTKCYGNGVYDNIRILMHIQHLEKKITEYEVALTLSEMNNTAYKNKIAELENTPKSKHEILCTGCKYEYLSYGSWHCQKDYECFRGCHTFDDFYEERESDQ